MEGCKSITPMLEGEETLIAAAQNLVKALETKKNLTSDARKILADLGNQLSSITKIHENKGEEGLSEVEQRLNVVRDKVMNWEEDQSMIWDCGSEEAYEYVKAVDEAQKLTESLESLCLSRDGEENELLRRARDVIQKAMERLEKEFKHMLVQNRQPFKPEHMSFRSEEDVVDEGSILSFGDDSVGDGLQRDSISRGSEEFIVDLVHRAVIPDLKCIANLMFDSNYDQECTQAFISVRKDTLDDCLFILDVERLSIEDVLKMEWGTLNSKIRRWTRAMKIFVRIYLASEKWLSDQIFGELDSISSICFAEASKASMLQLLNFAEAIAIGPRQPEKLLRTLDMYEVLVDLSLDIDALYINAIGSFVRTECQHVISRLGYCVNATFIEFENAVASNISTTPFAGGGIHHLTRYVMNYIWTLTDYNETLDLLLKDPDREDSTVSFSPDLSPVTEEDNVRGSSSCYVSPMAHHFQSLMSILECNLDDKSKLYKDDSLRHLFLMNNIHYMAEKVKSSELRTILGDEWIRKRNWKFQQHAMNYERATWSSILCLLKDEGIHHPGSNSVSRTLLKERLQSFYLAFEEVYRSQTGWLIPATQLREDLRISTSLKVIQAYRTFVGRHMNHLSEKNIKYSADDLENYLLDLFEGSPRLLHSFHRK